MSTSLRGWLFLIAALTEVAAAQGAGAPQAAAGPPAAVDAARLANAAREPDQWFTPGRDAEGTYYSPLNAINDRNAARLGFAWDYHVATRRGLEGTPVVVDGVMYAPGNWGRVYALDAASGKELWTYDPGVDGQWGRYACCDVVNRGLVVWHGRVYIASVDGYMHAIDAGTGKRIWKSDTLPARGPTDFHYAVTGAPVLAGDLIAIGNGGSDFKGARGFITALDLETGALEWRFYTVPRDPTLGAQDQPDLQAAAKTWSPNYDWSNGGGGSAWDGLAYDAALQLVYIGTGNATPYHGHYDPSRSGDELYVSSIVAVHADTGRLAWYFQEVPGEAWDYDTANKMILADLPVGGKTRRVIMQASKDGFFYVLDRATGEFLSAKPFAYMNWTKGLDPRTHRPIKQPAADWDKAPALIFPAVFGAHGWQPMSYSPKTGLVYIPVFDSPMIFVDTSHRRAGLIEGNFELAFFLPQDYEPKDLQSLFGKLPTLQALAAHGPRPQSRGLIRAIDPVSGKVAWERQTHSLWDGGLLATAGNLVVRGDAAGFVSVYTADTGKLIKQIDVGTSLMAAPMTYRVHGVQYLSVMAGSGGGMMGLPFPQDSAAYKYGNEGRIVTFRLDGGPTPKPAPAVDPPLQPRPAREGSAGQIAQGEVLYNRYCGRCHTFGRGLLPDLRRMSPVTHQLFYEIVLNGAYAGKGMARWSDVLSRVDAEAIHAYLVDQTWQLN
jgi:quinohemoprotein ethanol dehydrogenase